MASMIKDYSHEMSSKCMKIIECDTARISKVGDKLFLIIGFNRNTKEDPGQWVHHHEDGSTEDRDWDYISENVVASGTTEEELISSAEEYKRLCGITMSEYLKEEGRPWH